MDNQLLAKPTIAEVCLKDLYDTLMAATSRDSELGPWTTLEPETLVSLVATPDLTTVQLHRLYAKISLLLRAFGGEVLRTGLTPLHELLEDPIVCPYLTELVNNDDGIFSDPEYMPHVSSMEIAWLVYELSYLLNLKPEDWIDCPREFKAFCGYFLGEDGFSSPPRPFTFLTKEDLLRSRYEGSAAEPDAEVEANRQKALDYYVQIMKRALCNVHN